MKELIHIISTIYPAVALILVVAVVLANLFLIIRRRLPIKVNCWFCNSWTKVPYDDQNSFECPTCLQYNGFDECGGYNKRKPELYEELLNNTSYAERSRKTNITASNGLCSTCNHNQHLKVYQLAEYVPLVEKNYDVEIEHFGKQLEKAYKLCSKCEKVLRKTLHRQNASILGERVRQIQRKGLSFLDLKRPYKGVTKKSIFMLVLHYALFVLSVLILVNVLMSFDYSDDNIRKNLPIRLYGGLHTCRRLTVQFFAEVGEYRVHFEPLLNSLSDYYGQLGELLPTLPTFPNPVNYIPFYNKFHLVVPEFSIPFPSYSVGEISDNLSVTSITGLLLHTIIFLWEERKRPASFLSWLMLTVLSRVPFQKSYIAVQVCLLIFIAATNLQTIFQWNQNKAPKTKKKKQNIRSLNVSAYDFSDCSDTEPSHKTPKRKASSTNDNKKTPPNTTKNQPNTSYSSSPDKFIHSETSNFIKTTPPNRSPSKSPSNTASTDLNLSCDISSDLNTGLSNLYLGRQETNKTPPVFNQSKRVLSPSKLKSVTQNSWIAGGFWENSCEFVMPMLPNCSRSSSQSSGFVSQTNENVYNSAARSDDLCGGDLDRLSVVSEPVSGFGGNLYGRCVDGSDDRARRMRFAANGFVGEANRNRFYPILRPNETLYIHSAPLSLNGWTATTKGNFSGAHNGSLFKPFNKHNWADKKSTENLQTFSNLRLGN